MRRKLGEILLSSGVVGPGDIADALGEQSAGEPARLGDLLVARGRLTPAQLAQALAEQYGVPFTTLPPLPTAVLDLVPLDFQRTHRVVPLRAEGTTLHVAMADLSDQEAVAALQQSWTQVVVHAAPGDEIDALHGTLSGVVPAPRASPGGPGKPLEDELFSALDALEAGPPPGAPVATASALFGDLNLDEGPAPLTSPPAATPSGMFELTVDAPAEPVAASAPPEEELFELSAEILDVPPAAESESVVVSPELDAALVPPPPPPPSVPSPAAAAPPAVDEAEDEEALFYEAQLAHPSPAPIAPPPVVAPVAQSKPLGELPMEVTEESDAPALAEFLDGLPDGEPVPPLRDDTFAPRSSGPSVLEQLFIAPEEPVAEVAPPPPPPLPPVAPPPQAPPPPAPPPVASPPVAAASASKATSTSARLPAVKVPLPKAAPAKPEPVPPAPKPQPAAQAAAVPPTKAAAKEDLPDWLRDDSAAEPAAAPASSDAWTGELEALAPSKLITGVARALIRKGILTEQDILEALERKKS